MNNLLQAPVAIRHLQEEITRLENKFSYYEDDNIDCKLRIEAMKERIKMFRTM